MSLKTATDWQDKAVGSADLARKYRLAIIAGETIKFMGYPQDIEQMTRIVKINDDMSAAYYAASRAHREEWA